MKKSTLLVSLLALASLSACSSAPQQPLSATTLQAYDWQLDSPDWQLPGRAPLQLHFAPERLSLSGLCNQASAAYQAQQGQAQEGRLQVQAPMATLRACPEAGLMQLEQRVLAQLPQLQQYSLHTQGGAVQLQLRFADGSQWQLTGQPTAATRYGAPGERVFLEVAAHTTPCQHPLMPQAQCLRVRELRYDAQGLKQSSGDWQPFYGQIQGYQHEAGVRNVLRLQRYPAQPPGQAQPAYAYVLDLVVESAIER